MPARFMPVRRNATGAALGLALAVALAACGSEPTDTSGCSPAEASRVAGDPAATAAWYEELRGEDGTNIIRGIVANIDGNPLG